MSYFSESILSNYLSESELNPKMLILAAFACAKSKNLNDSEIPFFIADAMASYLYNEERIIKAGYQYSDKIELSF